MSPFIQTILSTIIGAIFGGSGVSLLTFFIQRHDKKADTRQKEYKVLTNRLDLISDAVRGQGHDRIVYLGGKYIQRGGITRDEYENLHDYLYEPYKSLGGNGTAQKIMNDVENLPIITKNEAYERDSDV